MLILLLIIIIVIIIVIIIIIIYIIIIIIIMEGLAHFIAYTHVVAGPSPTFGTPTTTWTTLGGTWS